MEKKWYAVYTKPRWEKKVDRLLAEKGMESYCPLQKIQRQWSDRKKIVEEPLFKSYVFVRIEENEQTELRMVNGVVNFVYWMGKPAIVKDAEIQTIRRFMNEYDNVEATQTHIEAGNRVVVQGGVLMGKSGTVKQVLHKKVEVFIESIGFTLTAYVEKSKIRLIEK
jgi:transcription antitermination factor NusG